MCFPVCNMADHLSWSHSPCWLFSRATLYHPSLLLPFSTPSERVSMKYHLGWVGEFVIFTSPHLSVFCSRWQINPQAYGWPRPFIKQIKPQRGSQRLVNNPWCFIPLPAASQALHIYNKGAVFLTLTIMCGSAWWGGVTATLCGETLLTAPSWSPGGWWRSPVAWIGSSVLLTYSCPKSLKTSVLVPDQDGKYFRVEAMAFPVLDFKGHYQSREVGIDGVLVMFLLLWLRRMTTEGRKGLFWPTVLGYSLPRQ